MCRAGASLSALVASIACFPLWLKICHWHIFLTRRARRLRPTPKVSSSSEAKDLGAVNTSVASEILHFVQNDSWWRVRCFVSEVLTYGQSEVCYASEVFAKAKVKFRLWRSDNQVCVSLCLHKRGTRRLLCSQKIYDFFRCESTKSGRFMRAKSI